MRALVKRHPKPGLWLEEVEKPSIGPTDILIKIKKMAICGTDLHIHNWDQWAQQHVPIPLVAGHEYVGEVVEIGTATRGVNVGDRVSGEGHITCGQCRNCRAGTQHLCPKTEGIGVTRQGQGSFAEYLSLPAENAFVLPDSISDDIASVLDPLGNAVHTALSFDLVGEDVLITGCGPVGMMAVAVARHVGARHIVVTDINDYRLAIAEKMGATRAINVKSTSLDSVMQELGMTEGFDVGLEVSGQASAFNAMLASVANGAKIALLGFLPDDTQISWSQLVLKGLQLKGIYGREMYGTWYKMAAMLQSGLDVTPVITHHFAIDDFQKGFDIMNSGQSGKVILHW